MLRNLYGSNFFCPYYTTLLQVEGYLKIKKKYHQNRTQVKLAGYLKIKKKQESTLQLGVAGYNKAKIFVTFQSTPQLAV